ncbi:peptidylprolyl isomerase [Belnapia sp. T18]|uniref:Parvulin-like PPIase n=1 Tax=Belnapia arida TaxID=2804533 RepID=A0ABS1U8C2_9PROT|nr:peptidylprolyl isomerase [Belnapia arida]MBL6079972.1 peptidylprolyl isomerase [Belnapia arida]
MSFRPVFLAALLVPAAALAQTAPQPAAPQATAQQAAEDPVLARVDGSPVRLSDVMATAQDVLPPEMRSMPGPALMQMLPPEVVRQLVDRAVTERVLTNAARSAGLDKDAEVQRRIRRAEEQELQQAYLSREVTPAVTDAAIRTRYEQEAGRRQGEEEVHARHILVQTEAEAKAVLAELAGGADFADVAKRRSRDPGAQSGGDLGFFKRGDMVPEFAEAAFALQPGQMTQAPIRTSFGWHVIKVEERRSAPVPGFEESRNQLRQKMLEEQVQQVVARARDAAKVERVDQPAPSMLDNAAPPTPAAPARPAAPQPQRR